MSDLTKRIGRVIDDVIRERMHQIDKHGVQTAADLPLTDGLAVLTEEVGEVAEAILEVRFHDGPKRAVYEELVQVAAVAIAMAEVIDE